MIITETGGRSRSSWNRSGVITGSFISHVIAPTKGSPSEQAGIRAGDIIEYIDGKATRDISLYDAKQLLNGATGTEVKLRVLRANSNPLTLTVKRGTTRAPATEARMEAGKVGILRLNSLGEGEANDTKAKLQSTC